MNRIKSTVDTPTIQNERKTYAKNHTKKTDKIVSLNERLDSTSNNKVLDPRSKVFDNSFFAFDLFFKKFTNLLMKDGKKIKASKILFDMLVILKKRIKKDLEKKNQPVILNSKDLSKIPVNFELLRLISQAIENITPSLEVRKVRIAGSTYLVPAVLSKKKQETLALNWLIESTKKRQQNSKFDFSTCLADEILDASRKLGQARQKRDELHRLAQMNRAYIRYRWW